MDVFCPCSGHALGSDLASAFGACSSRFSPGICVVGPCVPFTFLILTPSLLQHPPPSPFVLLFPTLCA